MDLTQLSGLLEESLQDGQFRELGESSEVGPLGSVSAASNTRCAGTFYDFPTFLLSSCPGLDHPALSEPAFIKMLWLEPLKTCRRIFMPNLLGFFLNVNNSMYFFGFFFAALGEINFLYRQQGDLPWDEIGTFLFFLLAIVLLITKFFLP